MLRIVLGVVAGFVSWMVIWFASEKVLSAGWPAFGEHQAAFQAAIEDGSPFTPVSTILVVHCVLALMVTLASGYLAAAIAGESSRAPLFLGLLLLALALVKAGMSWTLVPVWYHVLFTVILFLAAIAGGMLRTSLK